MSKIQATFERLQAQGRKALIPFITAGDPDPALTVPLMHTLVEAGADIIELGRTVFRSNGRRADHTTRLGACAAQGRQSAAGAWHGR